VKLYYGPGSCSLASHIVLEELGLKYEAESVGLKDKKTASGADYTSINPKGYVPCLKLATGELLTENTALLGYLGELNPDSGLIPPAGTMENFRVREWLGFISSEVHKVVSPLFRPTTPEATIAAQRELLGRRLAFVEKAIAGKQFLTGDKFTVADSYLFVILSWFGRVNVDFAPYPNLKAFHDRVKQRPAVVRAMTQEGLLKAA
jgi:glutathione S-transferase